MKVFSIFMAVMLLVFLLFMHTIRGLRTEKVLKEEAHWREVHIVWDWNKFAEWGREHRPFKKIEQEQKERTSEKTDTKK